MPTEALRTHRAVYGPTGRVAPNESLEAGRLASPLPASAPFELAAYQIDLWQRSVRYLDTLRERANNMLEHERAGKPPLLDFDYETVLDGRRLERPANYALLKITRIPETRELVRELLKLEEHEAMRLTHQTNRSRDL